MKESALCPRLAKSMDLIGKRWMGLILYQLLDDHSALMKLNRRCQLAGDCYLSV